MKTRLWSVLVVVALTWSGPSKAQCAVAAPSTGLGPCVDFMLASSDLLTAQANQLGAAGWSFVWGSAGSSTDYTNMVITIHQTAPCGGLTPPQMYYDTSVVAHEMGHAIRGAQQDTSTRDAYIASWCKNEGYAVINNIQGRDGVLVCSMNTVDIGVAASNPGTLLWLYSAGGDVAQNVGDAFCDNNSVSTTVPPKNYRDYYGDWYDTHY